MDRAGLKWQFHLPLDKGPQPQVGGRWWQNLERLEMEARGLQRQCRQGRHRVASHWSRMKWWPKGDRRLGWGANDHQDVVVDWKWSLDFASRRLEKRRRGELVCEMVDSGGARWASNDPERPWIGNGSEASCDCDTFGGRQSKCHFRSTRASLVNGPGGRLLCGD